MTKRAKKRQSVQPPDDVNQDSDLRSDLNRRRERRRRISGENIQLSVAQLKEENSTLKEDLNSLINRNDQVEKQMIELKNQNEIILEELKTAKVETENGRQRVEFLNNELEISKRERINLIEQLFDDKNLQKDWQQRFENQENKHLTKLKEFQMEYSNYPTTNFMIQM